MSRPRQGQPVPTAQSTTRGQRPGLAGGKAATDPVSPRTISEGPDEATIHAWDRSRCEVILTAPDRQWLLDLTRDLVADRLAASTHNIDIRTVYRWDGEVHEAPEARCMIRTRRSLIDISTARARQRHPYILPSVTAVPLLGGNADYVAWILAETAAAFGDD